MLGCAKNKVQEHPNQHLHMHVHMHVYNTSTTNKLKLYPIIILKTDVSFIVSVLKGRELAGRGTKGYLQ